MTKTELMETYTVEQLAEMVFELKEKFEEKLEFQKLIENQYVSTIEIKQKEIDSLKDSIVALKILVADQKNTKLTDAVHGFEEENIKLRSEVSHYRKAFDNAEKERDCQIAEYQKKIEELTEENNKLKGDVDGMNYQEKQDKTNNFYGIYANSAKNLTKDDLLMFLGILTKELIKNGIDFRYEMEKELKVWDIKIKRDKDIADFLPTEPIKVADMLINAEGEYEHNPIEKALYKEGKGTYRIFDISELRQIAEHLLVYCNHNGAEEKLNDG